MTRRWACVVILLLLAVPGWAWADEGLETGMAITVAEWAYDVRDDGDYDPNPSGVFLAAAEAMPRKLKALLWEAGRNSGSPRRYCTALGMGVKLSPRRTW